MKCDVDVMQNIKTFKITRAVKNQFSSSYLKMNGPSRTIKIISLTDCLIFHQQNEKGKLNGLFNGKLRR